MKNNKISKEAIQEIKNTRKLYKHPKPITNHQTDKNGFIINNLPKQDNFSLYRLIFKKEEKEKIPQHTCKEIINNPALLQKYVYKGIPAYFKHKIWLYILKPTQNINYSHLKRMISGYEYQIHVDIQRTLRSHFMFHTQFSYGQCQLFRILNAYANYNPLIGYCQGMSDFTAILLIYFPEEEAFHMLVNLINKNKLDTLFDHKLSKLPIILKTQEYVFHNTIPSILTHFVQNSIDFSVFVTSWYLTLFSRFHIELVLRIFDIFVFYGVAILPLVSSAILKIKKRQIMDLRGDELMEYLNGLDEEMVDEDDVIILIKKLQKKVDLKEINKILG